MDLIFALALLSLAAMPLALLSGWFDRRESRPLGALVNGRDAESWWRSTMPWPRGVQEEDDVTWSFRDRQPPGPRPDGPDEVWISPIHLRPEVRRRR
jgi:hypothetical protein